MNDNEAAPPVDPSYSESDPLVDLKPYEGEPTPDQQPPGEEPKIFGEQELATEGATAENLARNAMAGEITDKATVDQIGDSVGTNAMVEVVRSKVENYLPPEMEKEILGRIQDNVEKEFRAELARKFEQSSVEIAQATAEELIKRLSRTDPNQNPSEMYFKDLKTPINSEAEPTTDSTPDPSVPPEGIPPADQFR